MADLTSGEGLDAALAGADAIVHCASTGGLADAGIDVQAARSLLGAARRNGVQHVVFPGIVGSERAAFFPYYAARLEIEALLEASGVGFSILRATQFHEFAAFLLTRFVAGPFVLAPRGALLQPVDVRAVAARLAAVALDGPAGRLGDVAGPDILGVAELARIWLRARGMRRLVLSVPLPLPPVRIMLARRLVSEEAARIGISFREWQQQYGADPNPYARSASAP